MSVLTVVLFFSFVFIYTYTCGKSANFHSKCEFLPDCKCTRRSHRSMFKTDCSGLGLTSIPRFPDIIEELVLSKNKITEIKDDDLQNKTHLKLLDLSENEISKLRKSVFSGLSNLAHLNLRNNNLSAGNMSFINSPFEYLRSLTWLNVKNNFVSPYQPDLSSLISLETLSIDFISSETGILAPHFHNLTRLASLDMSGLTGHCSVKSLSSDSFSYILQIENLNISGCKIQSILKGTFAALKRIEVLDISINTCLKFAVLENVTFDLQFSAIKIFKFNAIHKTFEMNTMLKQSHIKHLKNTSLQELHCDSNRCQQIEKGALAYLPVTIEYIAARDNAFSFGSYFYDFLSVSVKTIEISEMSKFHVEDKYPQHCDCDVVSINSCDTGQVYDNETYTGNWTHLGQRFVPIPYQLININYSSSRLQFKSTAYYLSNNKIERVDLSNNFLSALGGPIYNAKTLKYVDLSSNMCTYLSTRYFSPDFFSLKELYLQNNLLGLVFPNDHNGDTFQHLHKLEIINLSDNNIPTLSVRFFKSQKSLVKLDLSNNILEGIDFDIVQMNNLSFINLQNNRITFLDTKVRSQLDVIATNNRKLQIDIGGNPLLCTCDTIGFVKWMSTTKVQMKRKSKYKCQFGNQMIDFKDPDALYRNLQKDCISLTPLMFGLVSAIAIFFFILCTGLIYRYRWKLRYLYYMVKIRSYKPVSSFDDNDLGDYMYGAFVSYADGDSNFVHKKLLTKLEKENGIQLCIHKRNFLPGNDIATNITSAIHNSRKTIVIISHNFMKSNWCLFEYNMARMESIYERKNENILFLIFIEAIGAHELPLHILELVHSQSYIEYPNDEYGDEVFWNQVITALNT